MLSVLFVDDDAPSGGDGLAWATAFDDLQAALDSASVLNGDGESGNDIDQIWIAEGVYKPSALLPWYDSRWASFFLVDNVTLYGGFAGTETALAQRDWVTCQTVLSGDLGIADDFADNAYTVVHCSKGIQAAIDGVTITEGNSNGPYSFQYREHQNGGGVSTFGDLTLMNCTISGNAAEQDGGGICRLGGRLTISNSVISANSAGNDGGGVSMGGGVKIANSTIVGNTAGVRGGGIDGPVAMANCILAFNEPRDIGFGNQFSTANNLIGIDPAFVRNPGTLGADDYGDLRLTSQSAAIDAGTTSYLLPTDTSDLDGDGDVGEPAPFDLDGNPRVYGKTIDIGAYEYQSSVLEGRETPSTVVTSVADTFDLYDSEISLREAVYYALNSSLDPSVTFAPELSGATILLDGTSIVIDNGVTIDASALDEGVTIDGNGKSRVITVLGATAGEVEFIDLTMTNGWADFGGAVFNTGVLRLRHCTFLQNVAGRGGGIDNLGSLLATNCVFSGNEAGRSGGAVYGTGSSTRLLSSTLSGNVAGYGGGGVAQDTGSLRVLNCTLSGNAAIMGGGVYYSNTSDRALINNTIIAGNTAATGPEVACRHDGTLSGSHNLIADGSGQSEFVDGREGSQVGTASAPIDPRFIRNPSDGGDGWGDDPTTSEINESLNDDYGDLRLQSDSPAVDAGDNMVLHSFLQNLWSAEYVDLSGTGRVRDGDDDGIATVDMGADEFSVPGHAILGDFNGDAEVNNADLDLVREHWGRTVPPGCLAMADGSGDGFVGSRDLNMVRANWGNAALVPAAASAEATSGRNDTGSDTAVYGPVRKSEWDSHTCSDAALDTWNAADVNWMGALEALETLARSRTRMAPQRGLVDLVLEGWTG